MDTNKKNSPFPTQIIQPLTSKKKIHHSSTAPPPKKKTQFTQKSTPLLPKKNKPSKSPKSGKIS